MNHTIAEVKEMISFWTAKEDSKQREIMLGYWVKQAQKFVKYSRKFYKGDDTILVANTGEEVKQAIRVVANFFKVPMKKSGECRFTQMVRLTKLEK